MKYVMGYKHVYNVEHLLYFRHSARTVDKLGDF